MTELVVPTIADADRIAALLNARAFALYGASEETSERVRQWFALPALDPDADMRLAIGEDGTAEGYADVSGPDDDAAKAWIDLRVLPGCASALALLFAWAQVRAADRTGPGGIHHLFVAERDETSRELVESAGYAVVRSSFEMERSLGGVLETPVWPGGLEVRSFEPGDAEAVHAAHMEAFEDHWGYAYEPFASWRLHNLGEGEDTSLWTVVWDRDEIAGVCINRPMRGEDNAKGWIGVLAVRRRWRRRGLGEALLRESFRSFAAAGKSTAGLGVDAQNTTGAVALYERVGLRVVRRSDTWEKTA